MTTLFRSLGRLIAYEHQHLPFIRSQEDRDLVVAIGQAEEAGDPVGFKQLALQHIASPSTVTRKLRRLVRSRVVRRITPKRDGRRVHYILTPRTRECFQTYFNLMNALRRGGDMPPPQSPAS